MNKRFFKRLAIGLILLLIGYSAYLYTDIQLDLEEKKETCLNQLRMTLSTGSSPDEIFQKDLEELQTLVEYSLSARSQMLEVSERLKENIDQPLASRDLLILKQGTEDYLDIRADLYDIANAYECATEVDAEVLEEYGVPAELRLKASMLSLASALTLYDNYLIGTIMFEQDARLRKVVNDPDMGFGLVANTLMDMTLAANSIESRHRIRKVITFYEQEKGKYPAIKTDNDFAYLELLIESSPAYNFVKKVRIKEISAKKFVAFERITGDMISEFSEDGFDLLSGLFGNTVGLYESRKGKLYQDSLAKKNIQDVLQPLDILLEKTPFRLTDKLIPGHFGHVAIWTGTEAELIDLDLDQNPYVKPHLPAIGAGSLHSKNNPQIIEALRSGVQLNTLDHFMNVDDVAILRPVLDEEGKTEVQKEALIMAFRQLGKEYDFNFDVNTTDKIVCSELAYISFPSIDWPTEKTLGRHSISPDNVAKLAWNNVPLELVMFYHDGQLVPEEQQVDRMIELMQE